MRVQNCYDYIKIGLTLRMLQSGNSVSKELALDGVEELLRIMKDLEFTVSLAYVDSSLYRDVLTRLEALPDGEDLTEELAESLRQEANTFEKVVFAESSIRSIYALPDRRFNTTYLLNAPEKLFKDGLYVFLDDIAKSDIASACRCLLFGEATASAFHILRATEAVLKDYYFLHRRQKRLQRPMWGPMVDQLRAKKGNKIPVSLLNSLDNIRTSYRNPTQHPEATYEVDSAQDLFGVCIDVIGKMGSDLVLL